MLRCEHKHLPDQMCATVYLHKDEGSAGGINFNSYFYDSTWF